MRGCRTTSGGYLNVHVICSARRQHGHDTRRLRSAPRCIPQPTEERQSRRLLFGGATLPSRCVNAYLAGGNYASTLIDLQRFEEAKSLSRILIPAVRRVFGESHELTLRTRANYALALYQDDAATLDDRREAVSTLKDAERIARRVFGRAHPDTAAIEASLQKARAALRARETPPRSS